MEQEQEVDAIAYYEAWADGVDETLDAFAHGFETVGDIVDIIRAQLEMIEKLQNRVAALEREVKARARR